MYIKNGKFKILFDIKTQSVFIAMLTIKRRFHSVVVIIWDFESRDSGSIPDGTKYFSFLYMKSSILLKFIHFGKKTF